MDDRHDTAWLGKGATGSVTPLQHAEWLGYDRLAAILRDAAR
ncbi:hypothetical protein [Tessaracoccus sp. MC1627]|nr:hypothetical protein [Tessaracoccus sp. MC1627]